jgi:16S rRNA (guanine966-N2)-methyltransferase
VLDGVLSNRHPQNLDIIGAEMSELRILGGTAKGRRLQIPDTARPTGGRVRKSLFDILETRYGEGSSFLDLYAGAGGVGLEAASRGYAVTMVEKDGRAVQILERNAKELRLEASTVRSDALAFMARTAHAFDIVFIDPPYDHDIPEIAQTAFKRPGLIDPDGVLIVQSPVQVVLPETTPGFRIERRVYGSNALTFGWLE